MLPNPREAAAFLRSVQSAFPSHHLFPGLQGKGKKKLKINKRKITDGSFVSELPVTVQPEESRV